MDKPSENLYEWKDDDKHTNYTSFTHEIDNELVFTANQAMDRIYLNAVQGRTKVQTITLNPKGKFYLGEGQPLYEANIPTISLVPGPDYLCAVGDNGHMEKIDVYRITAVKIKEIKVVPIP
ncbi:hypothetical protein [Paenibacillus zanthoxyli]|uniref:hypothetical protein n=1 Tax=Paenibacillus zanthoxyli TaxID=369399 RepID=UPI0004710017|nr:hypothetical protein [Paenibacillus zanthoxyli]